MEDDTSLNGPEEAHERKRNDNVPAQLTPLIGREREVERACEMLRRPEVRLLTFTGTGGIGKTRLSLQVASALIDYFTDGVYFVPARRYRRCRTHRAHHRADPRCGERE